MKRLSDHVAAYLMNSTPLFAGGPYTLYAGIDLCGIVRDGACVTDGEIHPSLDLLVCRKTIVAAGIVCNPETEHLFTTYLPSLPYVKLNLNDNQLPVDVDNAGYALPSEESLHLLYTQMVGIIHRPNGFDASRMRGCYTLSALPLKFAAATFKCDVEELRDRMVKKGLLDRSGLPTAYGTACGLLLRYSSDFTGKVSPVPATTANGLKELQSALNWKPQRKKTPSLSERIAHLTENTPTGNAYAVPALKKLLSASLRTLFRDYPYSLKELMAALERSDAYFTEKQFSPVANTKRLAYRDCLARICALRQELAQGPWLDSFRQAKIRNVYETLLLQLSVPFLFPSDLEAAADTPAERERLKKRISRHQRKGPRDFTIINTPLIHYYYAAAYLTQSDYPNWLYRKEIRPLLAGSKHPETAFDLTSLSQYCHDLHQDPDVANIRKAFPLLYNLLVEPIIRSTVKNESEE